MAYTIVELSLDLIQPDVSMSCGAADEPCVADMLRSLGMSCLPHCRAGAIAVVVTVPTFPGVTTHGLPFFCGGLAQKSHFGTSWQRDTRPFPRGE